MGKRYFKVTIQTDAIVRLDDAVIEAVDDEWRSAFYSLRTPEDIAGHIGYNMIVNRWPLSSLDGWADQPDENAQFDRRPEGEVIEVVELQQEEA